jgi:class 3 adenylate cyclase/predicted ATPase
MACGQNLAIIPQPAQQEATQDVQPVQFEPPPPEPPTPDAERRQLTVMFCDLVDSTMLSGQLDPEDLRDVIRAYQSTSAEVIERYDGYIAQHLGDGLMVYFGWPQAHEDDARRAVYAGLSIVDAMRELNVHLEQEKGVHLTVRIGVHTGLVVVGEIGKGASQEYLALGEAPNVASRIEGVAEPDSVAISAATYRLIQGYFLCHDLGKRVFKGVDNSRQVYRVVKESDVKSRLDIVVTRGLIPLVGRESEVALLQERWERVKDGQGQVVLLSGEAGIGKSRLLQVMKDHLTGEAHTLLECRSSPYYENTALYPITDMLKCILMWQHDDTPRGRLDKLEQMLRQYRLELEEAVPLFATLLSLSLPEGRYSPLNLSPQRQRQKTLETIVALLLQQAEQQPVLFILEDLHWTDPSTLELIDLLIDQTPTAALCIMMTCRPTFQPTWGSHPYLAKMTLGRLSRSQIEQIAEWVADGKRLPDEVLHHIVEKSDGVPLYVEEITKAVLEFGVLKEVNGQYELTGSLSTLAIPATLQDSLRARLDLLVTAKSVAQFAAVIGRQFSYALLQTVSQLDETILQHELARLVKAEIVYQRGTPPQATYTFKHALIQDAAYQSLLKSTRQHYHLRIAEGLQELFAETAQTQPELLAYHYSEGSLYDLAIEYWFKAGEQARHRFANPEAVSHLKQGLDALNHLSDSPKRHQQELDLCISLGNTLIPLQGYAAPEVAEVYGRAQELCHQVGDTRQLFPTLYGLCIYNMVQANHQAAYKLGEELVHLAHPDREGELLVGYRMLGWALLLKADLYAAQGQFERLVALYDPQKHGSLKFSYGQDHGVVGFCYGSWVLWLRGYPDQAQACCEEAIRLAQDLSHPLSLGYALGFVAIFQQMRRDVLMAQKLSDKAVKLCTDMDIPLWLAWGTFAQGWALAEQGDIKAGISRLRHGIGSALSFGAKIFQPHFQALLAEAYQKHGQTTAALHVLDESLIIAQERDEVYYLAEIHRLKGETLLRKNKQGASEDCFHQALDIARQQQARSWELRATTSLARLWQSQGKCQDAYDLLAPVYDWFTEGFDTADLKDANALIQGLGG